MRTNLTHSPKVQHWRKRLGKRCNKKLLNQRSTVYCRKISNKIHWIWNCTWIFVFFFILFSDPFDFIAKLMRASYADMEPTKFTDNDALRWKGNQCGKLRNRQYHWNQFHFWTVCSRRVRLRAVLYCVVPLRKKPNTLTYSKVVDIFADIVWFGKF